MPGEEKNNVANRLLLTLTMLSAILVVALLLVGSALVLWRYDHEAESLLQPEKVKQPVVMPDSNFVDVWTAPSDRRLTRLSPAEQANIRYGRELIAHTAEYLGPNGTVMHLSNGMNCQNCHLNAGTQPWGNNYFAVEGVYPKFRERSGMVENQVKRVNDCLERSLNGKALDSTSREMRAVLAYLKWLGSDLPPKRVPRGTGLYKLKELDRPTDPEAGRLVYQQKCQSCHQANGEGVMAGDGRSYTYPPLWGEHSYNVGAGLFRISNFAGFVKLNMPFGATYEQPQLTDEEAWDVAAFVNSQPRPAKDFSKDWPRVASKPFDHPFGPYADPYSEQQHKYGPYGPIKAWIKKNKSN